MESRIKQRTLHFTPSPLVDVTKTRAFKEIYAQRLRSYGMLYAKELNGSGPVAKDSNNNTINSFGETEKHRSCRSISDPNVDLIRTLSLRKSANLNRKKAFRTSMSDAMLQESVRRRIYTSCDVPTLSLKPSSSCNSLLSFNNSEIPEEKCMTSLQKRHSLIPSVSNSLQQRLAAKRIDRSWIRQSSLAYVDCIGTNATETLIHDSKKLMKCGPETEVQGSKAKFHRENNPRLQEAEFRTQKRYASIKSLEMDITKVDEFIARVKRQRAVDKRQ